MKKECVAMLLAGGQGSRLYVLTGNMAKPAVPFGGKFRIIDFPLSNCTNSGIDTVGVLTQYRPLELNSYIGSGQPWELDRMSGGVHILPPYQSATGAVWYKGTANAICTALVLWLVGEPWVRKLLRIKKKFGLTGEVRRYTLPPSTKAPEGETL